MPRKLGQHFLVNRAAIRAIVRAVDPQRGETIIEIGPGHGELTLPLARACARIGARLVAIEKDAALAHRLVHESWIMSPFGRSPEGGKHETNIVEDDALKLLPLLTSNLQPPTSYKMVGNIPYYITGKLLRIISELPRKPSRIVFTLQREVAERICAQPPAMNLLAAAVQIWAEPRILRHLVPADFRPKPEVESAVVKLESRIVNHESWDREDYYRLIKIIFKQPRQTIMNNLARGYKFPKEEIRKKLALLGLAGDERPQELAIEMLKQLSTLMYQST